MGAWRERAAAPGPLLLWLESSCIQSSEGDQNVTAAGASVSCDEAGRPGVRSDCRPGFCGNVSPGRVPMQ